MYPEPSASPKSPFKNPFLYSSLLIFAVILYVSYVLYARYQSSREYERQTKQRQSEERREEDRLAVEQLGGSELPIRGLSVSLRTIHRREPPHLSYTSPTPNTSTPHPPPAAA